MNTATFLRKKKRILNTLADCTKKFLIISVAICSGFYQGYQYGRENARPKTVVPYQFEDKTGIQIIGENRSYHFLQRSDGTYFDARKYIELVEMSRSERSRASAFEEMLKVQEEKLFGGDTGNSPTTDNESLGRNKQHKEKQNGKTK